MGGRIRQCSESNKLTVWLVETLDMSAEPLGQGCGENHISRVKDCKVVETQTEIQGQSRKREVKVRYKVPDVVQRLITGSVVATVI